MSLIHGDGSIVRQNLKLMIDPANLSKHGDSPYRNLANGEANVITNSDFAISDDVFVSNANSNVSGNSMLSVTNTPITSGSITIQWWMNLYEPPNVNENNNYRSVLNVNGTRDVLGIVLEQHRGLNFTIGTSTGVKRNVNSDFTPSESALNEWEMHTFTYDRDTGISSVYLNDTLVKTGPQTEGAGANATVAGEALSNVDTGDIIKISSDKSPDLENSVVPAFFGLWLIYNRALSTADVASNFNAMRKRYGI